MADENRSAVISSTHSDDVIFNLESLKEFIRLIKANGITGLKVYSVKDHIYNSSNSSLRSDGPKHDGGNELEFYKDQVQNRLNYFVVVKESIPWQSNKSGNTYKNEISGRQTFIKVGSNASLRAGNTAGTVIFSVDGEDQSPVYISPFNSSTASNKVVLRGDGQWSNSIYNNWLPGSTNTFYLGTSSAKWKGLYATTAYCALSGTASNAITASYAISAANATKATKDSQGNNIDIYFYKAAYNQSNGALTFTRGNGTTTSVTIKVNTSQLTLTRHDSNKMYLIGYQGVSSFSATGSTANKTIYAETLAYMDTAGGFHAEKVYNAVFNDYAEYRKTIDLEPGRVVVDVDDGSLRCSSARLMPGAQVISDTFGHSMGETDECKTPLAVAGRALVYPYQHRSKYHAGMAVCSAPNGTVDIMTREEIREYPDCIIGIVSEIPDYKTWGTDKVEVNGRIWIKVR